MAPLNRGVKLWNRQRLWIIGATIPSSGNRALVSHVRRATYRGSRRSWSPGPLAPLAPMAQAPSTSVLTRTNAGLRRERSGSGMPLTVDPGKAEAEPPPPSRAPNGVATRWASPTPDGRGEPASNGCGSTADGQPAIYLRDCGRVALRRVHSIQI